jgi:nucleoside phosphorylase
VKTSIHVKLHRTYDVRPAPLLVVAPTKRELVGLTNRRLAGVAVAEVGVGRPVRNAFKEMLIDRLPAAILSLGFGGGLDSVALPGDVVLAQRALHPKSEPVYYHDSLLLLEARRILAQTELTVLEGDLVTVDEPLLTGSDKREIGIRSSALTVDMEGYWLAEVAEEAGIPLLSVRTVIDEADLDLPDLVADIVADGGRNEWMHTLRSLKNPSVVGPLLTMVSRLRKARSALRIAGELLVEQLELAPVDLLTAPTMQSAPARQ